MHKKTRVIVLTGAGISAESGLKTFRDADGLWNDHSIYEVATPEAWITNKQLVLDFYNHRRSELEKVAPNPAHIALVQLESMYAVQIITQNVDNLHERAGSTHVLHLHGQLTQVRGEHSLEPIIDVGYQPLKIGDTNDLGEQLRPNIVWFGEDVPEIERAVELCLEAEILLIIGTSLNVYPASGLMSVVSNNCQIILIDPNANEIDVLEQVKIIKEKAGTAVPALVEKLCGDKS
ncbi:MAG: NAD-dependent deacetylase [Salibacteraceae bacterium]|jgi:NAD-dependent deacetylase